MKPFLSLLFCISLWSSPALTQDSKAFTPKLFLTPYIGIGVMDANVKTGLLFKRGDAKLVGSPVAIGVKTEFLADERFGLRLDLNLVHKGVGYYNAAQEPTSAEEEEVYHRRVVTKFRATFGFNFYFNNTADKKLYFTLNGGILVPDIAYTVDGEKTKVFYKYPNFTKAFDLIYPRPTLRMGFGLHKKIAPRLYFNGEIALGGQPLQLGLDIVL